MGRRWPADGSPRLIRPNGLIDQTHNLLVRAARYSSPNPAGSTSLDGPNLLCEQAPRFVGDMCRLRKYIAAFHQSPFAKLEVIRLWLGWQIGHVYDISRRRRRCRRSRRASVAAGGTDDSRCDVVLDWYTVAATAFAFALPSIVPETGAATPIKVPLLTPFFAFAFAAAAAASVTGGTGERICTAGEGARSAANAAAATTTAAATACG